METLRKYLKIVTAIRDARIELASKQYEEFYGEMLALLREHTAGLNPAYATESKVTKEEHEWIFSKGSLQATTNGIANRLNVEFPHARDIARDHIIGTATRILAHHDIY